MFKILTDTHKVVAKIVHHRIKDKFGLNLNLEKMEWGSIAPDVLPYYKFKRHYKDESIHYIATEIVKLIRFCRYSDLQSNSNPVLINYLSKKLGIISHYLCDYCCYPHAYRLTFLGNMKSHIKYETDLNIFVLDRMFEEGQFTKVISSKPLGLYEDVEKKLKDRVKNYIDQIIAQYMQESVSFENDMNYALDLSTEIAYFVIESILLYSEDLEVQFNV